MKTPKEKAKQLVDKMSFEVCKTDAKQCALIAVDEMLSNAGMIWGGRNTETGLTARDEFRKYWREVKQEIDKL